MVREADDLIQWIKSNAGRKIAGPGEDAAGRGIGALTRAPHPPPRIPAQAGIS